MPRRDLCVDVGDLLQRAGTRRTVERQLAFDQLEVSSSRIPADTPVAVVVTVESTADPGTLTIDGTVSSGWVGECRRCLTPIEGELTTEVHELAARRPIDEEIWELDGDELDLGTMVREALLLALPLAPLCSDECRGPAPEAFPAVTADEAGAPGDDGADVPADPRWAALDQLRFDD